jgi:hypothetical protein
METKATTTRAGGLAEAKRQFDQWRRSRKARGRIPEDLWRMAVGAAAVHGVYPTARRLRLNPTTLKKRMPIPKERHAISDATRFVELPWLGSTPAAECILEAEDQAGRKLRIQLKGGATAQVETLGRMLWRGGE